MEELRNRNDVKLVNDEKDYSQCTSKPIYMSHKIFNSIHRNVHIRLE